MFRCEFVQCQRRFLRMNFKIFRASTGNYCTLLSRAIILILTKGGLVSDYQPSHRSNKYCCSRIQKSWLMIIEKLQTDRNIVMTFQMSLIWNWYRFWLECNWFCGSYNVTTTGTCIVGPQKLNWQLSFSKIQKLYRVRLMTNFWEHFEELIISASVNVSHKNNSYLRNKWDMDIMHVGEVCTRGRGQSLSSRRSAIIMWCPTCCVKRTRPQNVSNSTHFDQLIQK